MREVVNLERLETFRRVCLELENLYRQKKYYGTLKAVNYEKQRNSGNTAIVSAQEQYVMRLEQLNKDIKEFEVFISAEKKIILTQINRIPNFNYQKTLKLYYIDLMPKWDSVRDELFRHETDFEYMRDTSYHVKIFDWRKRALNAIEEISSKPYVEALQAQMCLTV